jgi:hypothetical protein
MVRSVSLNESNNHRSAQNTPTPWDSQTVRDGRASHESSQRGHVRETRGGSNRDSRDSQRERIEQLGIGSRHHARNDSGATGGASSGDYGETQQNGASRRHDYDVQSMETDLSSHRNSHAKNPIPSPTVTVRSEFPTLNRSRQQQSLTCLVTIEVPDGKWHPDPEDLRHGPPIPPANQEQDYSMKSPVIRQGNDMSYESPDVLEEITEELRLRVDNWHGLEFTR